MPHMPDRARTRLDRTRTRVLEAAAAILEREGYAHLTMERVAAESGAAKTTLYRQWPTRAALCMDLYLELSQRALPDADTGDVARDLKQLARRVIELQTRTPAGAALVGLIAEAQRQPEARAALLGEFAERRREPTRAILRRALGRGQLRADLDVDLLIDALGGAVTFRLLQGHAPLNARFTDALVDLLLRGARP